MYRSVVLRAHPDRGESHIQRKANGEVATLHVTQTRESVRSFHYTDDVRQIHLKKTFYPALS